MCGCAEEMERLERTRPTLAKAVRPVHNAAMKHLPEHVRTSGGRMLRRVLRGSNGQTKER